MTCIGKRTERLKVAEKLGADEVFLKSGKEIHGDVSIKVLNSGHARNADFVFEASGKYDVFGDGIPLLKDGGTLAIYGVPQKPYEMNIYNAPQNFKVFTFQPNEYLAIDYVCRHLKKDMIPYDMLMTHRWTFEQLPEALEKVKRGEVIKGIVTISS